MMRSTDDQQAVDPVLVTRLAEQAAADPAQEFGNFFLSRFLQLDISYDDAAEVCHVRLPYATHLGNPQGSVHGGVVATALDISMGHLCRRYLSVAVTVEMQVRFFLALRTDGHCTGRVIRAGRRLVHLESRMTDDEGRLVAMATGCWQRLDAD